MEIKIDKDEAKTIMLNILKEVTDYCEENELRYYLAYGTLLGAIRHKGFIPWDDDIDIWMPRPDYNKLRNIVKEKSIGTNITILDYKKEKAFPFLKAIDNRTVAKEHFFVTEYNMGLYIDIFPLDGLPENMEKRNKILKRAIKLGKYFNLSTYRFNTGSTPKITFLKNLFYPFSRLLPKEVICKRLDNLCADNLYDLSEYTGNVVWGYPYKECIRKTCFLPEKHLFEGIEFTIPSGYDQILRNYYGDYMTLPPVEKRRCHYYDAWWK